MRKVGKATAVALLTPMTAAAIAATSTHADAAAAGCWPLASASITPPTGKITAGSTVHPSAKVTGMLLGAHLQISGPGLDQQVGPSKYSGTIEGDVKVPKAGYFTLAVIGDGTHCTYKTAGFSVAAKTTAAKPTPKKTTPGKSPKSGGSGGAAGNIGNLPAGSAGDVPGTGTLRPLNETSPFSLPSVAPDSAGGRYPTPDPQVAAPPTAQPQARNTAATSSPVDWQKSIAVALVLLLLSAHFGMWSRRQRLAAEAAGTRAGRPGKGSGEKKRGGSPVGRSRGGRPADAEAAGNGPGHPGPAGRGPGRPDMTAAGDPAEREAAAEARRDAEMATTVAIVGETTSTARRSSGPRYRGRRRRD